MQKIDGRGKREISSYAGRLANSGRAAATLRRVFPTEETMVHGPLANRTKLHIGASLGGVSNRHENPASQGEYCDENPYGDDQPNTCMCFGLLDLTVIRSFDTMCQFQVSSYLSSLVHMHQTFLFLVTYKRVIQAVQRVRYSLRLRVHQT